jgi:hypothetical protein
LDIGAALSLAVGTYPVTITATGTGVPQQAATLTVVVTQSAGGSNNYSMSFATCDPSQVPIWFAVQNSNGPWTRVTPVGTSFTFPVTPNMALAIVTKSGTDYDTNVWYVSGAEVTALRDVCSVTGQTGTKHLSGAVTGAGAPNVNYWSLSLGGTYLQRDPSFGPNFDLTDVPAGPRDLIASRVMINGAVTFLTKMVVRRNVNYSEGAAIPVVDLNGSEPIVPVPVFVTLNNSDVDQGAVSVALLTARGISSPYYTAPPNSQGRRRYFAIPADQIQPGEFHVVSIFQSPPDDSTKARFVQMVRAAPADETVTLGPALNLPTFTTLSAATPVRVHMDLVSQQEYGSGASIDYKQSTRVVSLLRTAGSAGGTPTKWGLDIPDLSAAGYDPTWGLQAGNVVKWTAAGLAGDIGVVLGAAITRDAQVLGGVRTGSITP